MPRLLGSGSDGIGRMAGLLAAAALLLLSNAAIGAVARPGACAIDGYVDRALLADCEGATDQPTVTFRCSRPRQPAPPAGALRVTDFGATPDDDSDDAPAIQRALDALQPGQWLVFPPGTYLQGRSLLISREQVTLWGEGATLRATNPADQALRIVADRVAIHRFRLTARTDARGDQPTQARIAVYPLDERRVTSGTVIRGNRIVDDPGREGYGNASSAAGIFMFRAVQFRIEDNVVRRTLADGIHLTAGTRDGVVMRNVVRETGDDTIAVVSYQKHGDGVRMVDDDLSRNLLIAGNDVGGQYWGRGITVVGGRNVAIVGNTIADAAMSASVYVARENFWMTDGVDRVLVAGNRIERSQVAPPAYNYRNTYTEAGRTEQGAVEVYSWVWYEEKGRVDVDRRLAVTRVAICSNAISQVRTSGIRIGAGPSGWLEATDYQGRRANFTNGRVERVTVVGNRFREVARPFVIEPVVAREVACGAPGGRVRASAGGRCPQGGPR